MRGQQRGLSGGRHSPESSRFFHNHRNSYRDARCWDAADGPRFRSSCEVGALHLPSPSETEEDLERHGETS